MKSDIFKLKSGQSSYSIEKDGEFYKATVWLRKHTYAGIGRHPDRALAFALQNLSRALIEDSKKEGDL